MAEPVIAFDTLQTAENLKSAGIEELHAKAIATAMRDAVISGTATRADLVEFKSEITSEFAEFKSEVRDEISGVKSEISELRGEMKAENASMKVWLMTTTIAVGGIIIAAAALF